VQARKVKAVKMTSHPAAVVVQAAVVQVALAAVVAQVALAAVADEVLLRRPRVPEAIRSNASAKAIKIS
jgi:hypothetical protein